MAMHNRPLGGVRVSIRAGSVEPLCEDFAQSSLWRLFVFMGVLHVKYDTNVSYET